MSRTLTAPAPVVKVQNLTKRYRNFTALDKVSLQLEPNKIYGLLGRNGAGKTTIMSILTAQGFKTSGAAEVFGGDQYENDKILDRICFIRESTEIPGRLQRSACFQSGQNLLQWLGSSSS